MPTNEPINELTMSEKMTAFQPRKAPMAAMNLDRKSTRLNSSHVAISYAVFCLNHRATSAVYTLSLHDALPISPEDPNGGGESYVGAVREFRGPRLLAEEDQGDAHE